jgi:hypothetical protein
MIATQEAAIRIVVRSQQMVHVDAKSFTKPFAPERDTSILQGSKQTEENAVSLS